MSQTLFCDRHFTRNLTSVGSRHLTIAAAFSTSYAIQCERNAEICWNASASTSAYPWLHDCSTSNFIVGMAGSIAESSTAVFAAYVWQLHDRRAGNASVSMARSISESSAPDITGKLAFIVGTFSTSHAEMSKADDDICTDNILCSGRLDIFVSDCSSSNAKGDMAGNSDDAQATFLFGTQHFLMHHWS